MTEEISEKTAKANEFIEEHKHETNGKFKPYYHAAPPLGWMNDPNGLIYIAGRYHLYYQFNPFGPQTGDMYWGHLVSEDLVTFSDCGVAIAPAEEGESVFSGGAIECNGAICAFYTLHRGHGDTQTEEVYKAVSHAGFTFGEGEKVFDNETLPRNISRTEFRDPCPVKVNGKYYVFVGGKEIHSGKGVVVVLGGDTPDKLKYEFYLGPYYELGEMGECPSYFEVDGKSVLVVSGCRVPQRENDFKNLNSSVFIVGDLDFEKGKFNVDFIKEIDKGDTFYAPQFVRGLTNPVMIGWLEMWEKLYPTKSHGWVGTFSAPREISLKDGDIFQTPVKALENYEQEVKDGSLPKCADLTFDLKVGGVLTVLGADGKVTVGNDGSVYLDTRVANNAAGCVRRTNGVYDSCRVRVLLDVSSAEVFVDGGREVISSRIYLDGDYRLYTDGADNIRIKAIWRKQ